MPEITSPAKVVWIKYACDGCGGEVKHAPGVTLMSNPPKFLHVCEGFGREYRLTRCYPTYNIVPDSAP